MPLIDILTYVSEVVGFQPTDDDKRAQLLRWINRAGRELWDSHDLPGSLLEQTFSLADAANDQTNIWQITFPWYVDQLRGVRYPNSYDKVNLVSPHPRYHARPWKQPFLQWRIMRDSPIFRELSASVRLRVTLANAESDDLVVTLITESQDAARQVTELSFASGVAASQDDTFFADPTMPNGGVISIRKDLVTDYDIIIKEVISGTEIARIPNRLFTSSYKVVQIHDETKGVFEACVDVLFKTPYIPLWHDSDVFVHQKLEDALVWKVRANWYSTKADQADKAVLAEQKAIQHIQAVCQNHESELEKLIQTAPNGLYLAPLTTYPYRYALR